MQQSIMSRRVLALALASAAIAISAQPTAAQATAAQKAPGGAAASDGQVIRGTARDLPAEYPATLTPGTMLRIEAIASGGLDPVLTVRDAATGEFIREDDDGGEGLDAALLLRTQSERAVIITVSAYGSADGGARAAAGKAPPAGFELRFTRTPYTPQPVRELGWQSVVGGALLPGDSHSFTFAGAPGEVLEMVLLNADPEAATPTLELLDASGAVIGQSALTYREEGGASSRLRRVLPASGVYTVRALADPYAGEGSEYTLRVAERQIAREQAALQTISIGQLREGRLGDGRLAEGRLAEGRLADGQSGGDLAFAPPADLFEPLMIAYRLDEAAIAAIQSGEGGVTFRLDRAESDDPALENMLDPLLEIGLETPLGFASLARDDDSAGDRNAMIPIDLGAVAGNADFLALLRVRVSSFSGEGGAFTLRLNAGLEDYPEEEMPPMAVPPPPVRVIPAPAPPRVYTPPVYTPPSVPVSPGSLIRGAGGER